MKILFIGGSGLISSACAEQVIKSGHDLYLMNRGLSRRGNPAGAVLLTADIEEDGPVTGQIAGLDFDVVVDWIVYHPTQIERDYRYFRGKLGQYIFISSASAYAKPPRLPITEDHPLENPFWEYSRNKIACEQKLWQLHNLADFPVTIVRPSHTYDASKIPLPGGHTALYRILNNQPVLIHDQGSSLWTLTHHRDFARGFSGLLGRTKALGQTFHITSDEALSWNEIAGLLFDAAGKPQRVIHIPSEIIAGYDPEIGEGILGDKRWSLQFDNTKIKKLVPDFRAEIPFRQGAQEMVEWFRSHPEQVEINWQRMKWMGDLASAGK